MPDISHAMIEKHEEAAIVALIGALLLGVVSLVVLWLSRRGLPRRLIGATLVLAFIVSGIMAWTANLGGQINHPEIRSETTALSIDGDIEGAGDEAETTPGNDNDDD